MPNNNPYNHCLLLTFHEQVLAISFSGHVHSSVCFEFSHLSLALADLSMLEPATVLTNQFQHSVVPLSISLSACPLFSQFCRLYPYVDVVYWQPISQGFFYTFKPAVCKLSMSKQRTIPSMHWKRCFKLKELFQFHKSIKMHQHHYSSQSLVK